MGFRLQAINGESGQIEELLFAADSWSVRRLVIRLGGKTAGRRVVVLPSIVKGIDVGKGCVYVSVNKEHVENCPSAPFNSPFSGRNTLSLHEQYLWMPLWRPGSTLSQAVTTGFAADSTRTRAEHAEQSGVGQAAARQDATNVNLHSAADLIGHEVWAADDCVGRVEGVLFNDLSWMVHYVIVDAGDALCGRKLLIERARVEAVLRTEKVILVGLPNENSGKRLEINSNLLKNRDRVYERPVRHRDWRD